MCWLQLNEMTLKSSLNYDAETDSIVGFSDDGTTTSASLAKNALVMYVVGMTRLMQKASGILIHQICDWTWKV